MERKELIKQWYISYFPKVASFIAKRGGTLDDARDIFQEGLIVWYEKRNTAFHTNEEAYLFGVCKNLWFKHSTDQARFQNATIDPGEEPEPTVSENRLLQLLDSAGKKCMQLLQRFYYDNEKVETIREEFGFSTNHSTAVQKYKCLEKVRETVKQNSLSYESFFE
ncbi:RNA polymerase sigma factor [Sinomicrobium oceani]|uniref:RNA polymerase sigma factor n=1 Tax=Sinomicrobium oceani TaxID=1150368 RepID=UPI00227ACEFA|nr:sigma-70 family RNA polymerase sigma factor [Sinomicrobium oceani]